MSDFDMAKLKDAVKDMPWKVKNGVRKRTETLREVIINLTRQQYDLLSSVVGGGFEFVSLTIDQFLKHEITDPYLLSLRDELLERTSNELKDIAAIYT